MRRLAALLLLAAGTAVGLYYADLDQRLFFLRHRSALTHGFLLPLLLFTLVRRRGGGDESRWFVIGLCMASAVHLCFDLFPKGWGGNFARVHVPGYGWLDALLSQAWLLGSVLVCLYLAFRLIGKMNELALGMGRLAVAFALAAAKQPRVTVWALAVLALTAFVAFVAPGDRKGGA